MEWFYDKNGSAQFFLFDDRLISKTGKNLGWLINGHVYALNNGKHLGWFDNGVLYDEKNSVLAFTYNAKGNIPYKPSLSSLPSKPSIPSRPYLPSLSSISSRPSLGNWSVHTIDDFFNLA
jgi:hypothetical protein